MLFSTNSCSGGEAVIFTTVHFCDWLQHSLLNHEFIILCAALHIKGTYEVFLAQIKMNGIIDNLSFMY